MYDIGDLSAPLPRLGVVNKWIIVYDDGKSPIIHTKTVEADTMEHALAESGVSHIWACALNGHVGAAAASLLNSMKLGVIEIKARIESGFLTPEELNALDLYDLRKCLKAMSDKDLAALIRSSAMDYKSINVTAKAEALARLLTAKN